MYLKLRISHAILFVQIMCSYTPNKKKIEIKLLRWLSFKTIVCDVIIYCVTMCDVLDGLTVLYNNSFSGIGDWYKLMLIYTCVLWIQKSLFIEKYF